MEPEDVADYARADYWNDRYRREPQYDWFSSVYDVVVEKIVAVIDELHRGRCSSGGMDNLKVLHLGCGNSLLCKELATRCASMGISLHQTAVDYSAVVIARMKEVHSEDLGDSVEWLEADVRAMPQVPSGTFDLVIDKGTMDALQADKNNENLDEDIEAMLLEVSRVLLKTHGAADEAATRREGEKGEHTQQHEQKELLSCFLQVTWEIPYYRLHHTKRAAYAWGADSEGTSISTCKLGSSDLYRFYRYDVYRRDGGEKAN
jgi:ubiquinone/menaquinone biosynthesis C-methylase UbiE